MQQGPRWSTRPVWQGWGVASYPQVRKQGLSYGHDCQDRQKALEIIRRQIQQDSVTTEGGNPGYSYFWLRKQETVESFIEKEDIRRVRFF